MSETDSKTSADVEIKDQPYYHYLALPVLDKHLTVAPLDKLSPNQCLPIMRSMINMLPKLRSSHSVDHVVYPFPNPTAGFVPEPKTVVQVKMCPSFFHQLSAMRQVLATNREGIHSDYQPHITFANQTEARQFIETYQTSGFQLDRLSLINAKLKQEVFSVPLQPVVEQSRPECCSSPTWNFFHPKYKSILTAANDWLFGPKQ